MDRSRLGPRDCDLVLGAVVGELIGNALMSGCRTAQYGVALSNGDRESPGTCILALRVVDAPPNIPVVVWGRFMLDPIATLGRDEVNVGSMMPVEAA